MKWSFLAIVFLSSFSALGQYYYKDILGTKETADLYATYAGAKVKSVLVKTYDGTNTRITDLFLQQQFSPSTRVLTTIARTGQSRPDILRSYFDEKGRLISTVDSSAFAVRKSIYHYDPQGLLTAIQLTSLDSSGKYSETEEHIWQYKNSTPVRLVKIKNRVDTTYVDLRTDEDGHVIEEQESRRGKKAEPFYYYYDEQKRLTDIVRFNTKAGRLLPEYLFEYSGNKIIQRINVPSNSSEYIIWRYQFNDQGLKTKEAVYNKQKQLTGRIEYEYGFY